MSVSTADRPSAASTSSMNTAAVDHLSIKPIDIGSDEEGMIEPPRASAASAAGVGRKKRRIVADDEDENKSDEGDATVNLTDDAPADPGATHDAVDDADDANDADAPATGAEIDESEAASPPRRKKLRKGASTAAPSTSNTLRPQHIEPIAACASQVAAFTKMLSAERTQRTGWIPSLQSRYSAAAMDAQETLLAAIAQVGERDNEVARRRETSDAFLANLAAKYARPTKPKGAKKVASTEATPKKRKKAPTSSPPNATNATADFSNNAATDTPDEATAATAATAASAASAAKPSKKKRAKADADSRSEDDLAPGGVPSDMEFLVLREQLGFDRKLK